MTEQGPIRLSVYGSAPESFWSIGVKASPMLWSIGVAFPDRRRATAVARSLSLAFRENGVSQAPVLALSPTDASWVRDLAQEEIENTENMLLEEKRTVDRSVRLNYEWLVELDALTLAEDGPLELDFGQACTVVDLLHEYLDTEDDEDPDTELAQRILLRLRNVGMDISVYYTENSAHPGYRYDLGGGSDLAWYKVYNPNGDLIANANTRSEVAQVIAKHHGPPVGSQMKLEDQ